jgi:hypothetical protein
MKAYNIAIFAVHFSKKLLSQHRYNIWGKVNPLSSFPSLPGKDDDNLSFFIVNILFSFVVGVNIRGLDAEGECKDNFN